MRVDTEAAGGFHSMYTEGSGVFEAIGGESTHLFSRDSEARVLRCIYCLNEFEFELESSIAYAAALRIQECTQLRSYSQT